MEKIGCKFEANRTQLWSKSHATLKQIRDFQACGGRSSPTLVQLTCPPAPAKDGFIQSNMKLHTTGGNFGANNIFFWRAKGVWVQRQCCRNAFLHLYTGALPPPPPSLSPSLSHTRTHPRSLFLYLSHTHSRSLSSSLNPSLFSILSRSLCQRGSDGRSAEQSRLSASLILMLSLPLSF